MSIFDKIKNSMKSSKSSVEKNLNELSVRSMEMRFQNGDIYGTALILRKLLERYGERKKKNHKYKGRDFIHFILSSKHKNLKNVGYDHWKNINKVIHKGDINVYPYTKEVVKNAIDFFKKEIKSL